MRSAIKLVVLWVSLLTGFSAQVAHGSSDDNTQHAHQPGTHDALAPASHTDLSIYQLQSNWRDDTNAIRSIADLRGKPVVVLMIYTSCQYVCPVLVADAKRIEAALDANKRDLVTFALFSFDPARDTPDKLADYRRKRHLAADNWVLFTASDDEVLELAAVLGVRFKPDGRGDFQHSNLITVLDADGVIRHRQAGMGQQREETIRVLKDLLGSP